MKSRIVIIVLALVCLGWYLSATLSAPTAPPAKKALKIERGLPAEAAALSGVWEGSGPGDLPARLVVEDLREHWAIISYTWGDNFEGKFRKGWDRIKAKVLPGGKLFWHYPGDWNFQLSEDWNALVGTRENGRASATSILRRVPSEVALNPFPTSAN